MYGLGLGHDKYPRTRKQISQDMRKNEGLGEGLVFEILSWDDHGAGTPCLQGRTKACRHFKELRV